MDVLNYYKLKQKYTDSINQKKKKIRKNEDLTIKEKRAQIKKIIGKCANCNKPGGTIFEERNGMLKAVCGSKTPCNLNINIKRKFYDIMRDVVNSNEKKMENLKMRIIMTKLDYLFGYNNSKDEIVDKFNILKNELAVISEKQLIYNKKYADIISGIHREPLLIDATNDLAMEIDELKKIYKQYEEDPNSVLITAMVEKYITTLRPLVEKINQLKYGYYELEKTTGKDDENRSDDIYTLVANPYRFDQLEQERK